MYTIVLNPEAQQELEEAYRYYFEQVSPKVAEMFFEDLQAAYSALEINPFYQIRTKTYRALPLKKFPYLLFFEIEEKEKLIKILAVFNTNKDSKRWP